MDIKLTIPTDWEDITVGKFQEIVKLNDLDLHDLDKMIEIISILSDEDPDIIKRVPFGELKKINEELKFIYTKPKSTFKNIITIDNVKYGLIKMENISIGEMIDLENYQEDINSNLHLFLAILYRPLLDQNMTEDNYKIKDYDSNDNNIVGKLFQEKLSIDYVNGVVVFFSIFGLALSNNMMPYSQLMMMTQDLMN